MHNRTAPDDVTELGDSTDAPASIRHSV